MITSSAPHDNHIGAFSQAAIREEMGDRLRILLPALSGPLPKNMMLLIEQLARESAIPRMTCKTGIVQ